MNSVVSSRERRVLAEIQALLAEFKSSGLSKAEFGARQLKVSCHFLHLLGRDANGAIQRNTSAGEESGEKVALIAFGVG